MEFLDLPDELILAVFRNLTIKDLLSVRLVSETCDSVSKCDALWRSYAARDFQVFDNQLWDGWRFIDFYQKVLYPYRFMFGWWKRQLLHYGGLFRISVESDGIHCYECLPPLDRSFLECRDIQPFIRYSKARREPLTDAELVQKYVQNSFDSDISDKTSDSDEDSPPGEIEVLDEEPDSLNNSNHRMRFNKLFTLRSVGKQLRLYCYQSWIGLQDQIGHRTCSKCQLEAGHDCQVKCGERNFIVKTEGAFSIYCDNKEGHDTMNFNYWFELHHGFHVNGTKMLEKTLSSLFYFNFYHIRVKQFKVLAERCGAYDFQPLVVSKKVPTEIFGLVASNSVAEFADGASNSVVPNVERRCLMSKAPVLPGVYFGTYSVHGWEMLMLRYELVADMSFKDEEVARSRFMNESERGMHWVLSAWKITGDPNIPAGQLSFRIHLNKPIYLSGDEADEEIRVAVTEAKNTNCRLSVDATEEFSLQNFEVPEYYERRYMGLTLPKLCKGRFLGDGQVAGENFHNPSFTDVVFSVFDDGAFGLFWLELGAVAAFYRSDQQPAETVTGRGLVNARGERFE